MPLLEVKNLTVAFDTSVGTFHAVRGIDLSVDAREVLAIVGESGSGKSVAMLSVMGLLPDTATVTADKLELRWPRPAHHRARGTPQDHRQGRGDDLPGADDLAQPLLHRRLPDRGGAALPPRHGQGGAARGGRSSCSSRSASPTRRRGSTRSRTRCRAGRTSA